MKTIQILRAAVAMLAIAALGACSGDEITTPEQAGHATVENAALYSSAGAVIPELVLTRGQTTRVEVRFLDHDGARVTGLETEHDAALTFTPAGLATATPVSGQKFMFDVAAQAAGSGTVAVGYGHHGATSEKSFGPFAVTVR